MTTPERPDIPPHMREVRPQIQGAEVRVMRLSTYLIAEHVLTTTGLAGLAEIIGLPGDSYEGGTVQQGRVRAQIIFPFMNDGRRMTESFFSTEVDKIREDLDKIWLYGQEVLDKYPPTLVREYEGAKRDELKK